MAVDDEETILNLIVELLQDLGYAPVSANRGDSALALIQPAHPLDLLITDIRMPGMSGVELAQRIRLERPELPVIFVTGYATEFQASDQCLPDRTALLTKPFSLDALAKTVCRMVVAH